MLDTMDQSAIHHIRKLVNDGRELRIIFDNFDFKILTNVILKGNTNEVSIMLASPYAVVRPFDGLFPIEVTKGLSQLGLLEDFHFF